MQAFRYFVIDQSVILGILEEPIGNCEEAQPTVSCDWRDTMLTSDWPAGDGADPVSE